MSKNLFQTPPRKKNIKKKQKYRKYEENENEDYIPIGGYYEDWSYTSNWKEYQIKSLNINLFDTEENIFFSKYNKVDIKYFEGYDEFIDPNLTRESITKGTFAYSKEMTKNTITLGGLLYQVYKSKNQSNPETFVDSVVHQMLSMLGFGCDGFLFRQKPKWSFMYNELEIISEADFGVYRIDSEEPLFTLVEESKKLEASYTEGKYQIVGELFVHGYKSYLSKKDIIDIFGIKIRGFDVSFYRGIFPKEYYNDIDNGFLPKEEKCEIKRLILNNGKHSFDLSKPEERKIIADIIMKIRSIMFYL